MIGSSRLSRTSLDLELDLRASEVKKERLEQEISRLEQLKAQMESARSHGQAEPEWLSNNEQLQQFLAQTDALVSFSPPLLSLLGFCCSHVSRVLFYLQLLSKEKGSGRSGLEERAERLMHRVTKDAKKLRRSQQLSQPDIHSFRSVAQARSLVF